MTTVGRIFEEQGQSLWLDNLARTDLRDGTLARLVASGIRGVTANPTIVARAIESSDAYDEQFATLVSAGHPVADAYEELVIADVVWALEVLRPTFDQSRWRRRVRLDRGGASMGVRRRRNCRGRPRSARADQGTEPARQDPCDR